MKNPDMMKSKQERNPVLDEKIRRHAKDGEISCAEAMQIAAEFDKSPLTVGRMLDSIGIHLSKCQLGLFGCIHPQNRLVKAARTVSPELEEEIRKALQREFLPCAMAWHIAHKRDITGMAVAEACEYLKIRIKPCQFGAF